MAVKKWTALFLSVLLLTGCTQEPAPSQPGGQFQPGRYQGTGEGYGGTITVEVEVSADRIEAVSILSHNESRGVCEAAFEQIPAEILRQGTPYVELVAGATLTSQGVVDAAAQALEQAGGEFTPPDPEPEVRTQRELYAGLVIAGAGGAGMTAAAEAVREGGATVLVLEQQDIIGGETLYEPVLTLSDGTLTSGYGMLGDLRAEVEEAGAELLTGVKLTGLEVTDGRVTGVRAESADTDYLIHAQYGVILATGDYGGNPELVLAGAGETGLAEGLQEHFRTLSRGSSDGSGLTAALEAGAAASGLGQLEIWDSAPEQRRLGESRELLCVDSDGRWLTVPEEESAWLQKLMELPEGAYWAIGPAESAAEPQTDTAAAQKDARLVTAGTLEELAPTRICCGRRWRATMPWHLRGSGWKRGTMPPNGEPRCLPRPPGASAPMSGAPCCGRTAACCRGSTLWGQLPPVWRTTAPNCGRRRNGRCSCPGGLCAPPWACRTNRRSRRRQTEPRPVPEQPPEACDPDGAYQPPAITK